MEPGEQQLLLGKLAHSGSMIDYGGNCNNRHGFFLLLKGQIACSFCFVRHHLEHNQLIPCMLDKYAAGSMQRHASESVHANILLFLFT